VSIGLDPRTPILIGGGQMSRREDPLEPVDLMALAARLAAEEAGAPDVLRAVDTVFVVGLLSWTYRNPGALLAERIGASPRRTGYTGDGGSNPQALVHRAARAIQNGDSDVALIGGAESWRTRMKLKAQGVRPDWTKQDGHVPEADILIPDVPMRFEGQLRAGLDRPSYAYPLIEQAIRIRAGSSTTDHQQRISELWSRFSEVAATNPYAWIQRVHTPEEIGQPSESNRMVATPYTKLLNSNNMVDQSAVLLLTSVEAAKRYEIPRDRWIFPLAGAEANDRPDLGERWALDVSPAIRFAGSAAISMSGQDNFDFIDVYSCFPSAVEIAAEELKLPLRGTLTVTGGLTFAGGPWNNYVSHSIATVATKLRERGKGAGLVTANGGYLTKHAIGVYGTEPPEAGFNWRNVQDEVDKERRRKSLAAYDGAGTVEAWTTIHGRDGEPEKAIVSVVTPAEARTFAVATGEQLARILAEDVAGEAVSVDAQAQLRFASL
jgi:acetyl-CoA C-acetyltransferase